MYQSERIGNVALKYTINKNKNKNENVSKKHNLYWEII